MSKSDYNFMSRVLHRLALQSNAVAEMSFDMENALTKKKDIVFSDNPVFISGLARSGTTVLMRYLYETGLFRSLTYLDMPFVLMPNIWKRMVSKKSSIQYKERAHLDKIMVGFDSPEALEEVFWRVFSGDKYIDKNRLKLYEPDIETLNKFQDYIHNILVSADSVNQARYLSKNNNNLLRLRQLQNSMPNANFIIPFRDPLQHALSLLNQHIHFSKIQQEDKFSLDYMNWLGHFEFGFNQKSFFLNDEKLFQEMQNYNKTDINFWLLNWKNYYKYVNEHATENAIIFNYEDFCREPTRVLSKLFTKLNISASPPHFEPFNPDVRTVKDIDESLLKECTAIFEQLKNKHLLWFNS